MRCGINQSDGRKYFIQPSVLLLGFKKTKIVAFEILFTTLTQVILWSEGSLKYTVGGDGDDNNDYNKRKRSSHA